MIEKTIGETISQLHQGLSDYIEATYHISHPHLIEQRRTLLNKIGVISQKPYVETTPRYIAEKRISELGLSEAVEQLFAELSESKNGLRKVVHDPPYNHQFAAMRHSLLDDKSLVVITGTGSGKTECFLLPILGKLAKEASSSNSFKQYSAVRALVLYPMNALVNDQLGRMRLLFGDPRVVEKFQGWSDRPLRFARYTSRTLYPGVRTVDRDQSRLAPLREFYVHNLEVAGGEDGPEKEVASDLVRELQSRGKWPAKPDLLAWYGARGQRWFDKNTNTYLRCVTLPMDSELLTRHEVLDSPPDVLVTNYSMLEYMLMRPIERPVFDQTRRWLRDNPRENFLLVLDEAHLYRGAAGAEVALLLRRLRQRLGIPKDRIQIICTSASFQNSDHAPVTFPPNSPPANC